MNRYTGAPLAVLNEVSDTQKKSKAPNDADSEDTLTASSSGSQDGCDEQSTFDEQFVAQPSCGDRITIEITDPHGRCVELVKQLEAVKRAIVAPLENEIARIKNSPAEELRSPEVKNLRQFSCPL
ncbi:hypothetical protein MHU86_10326 [Fragilaria crotonensis]|nr:hypothetical protein MHU86_10326 [Fragilaria crotonensis]